MSRGFNKVILMGNLTRDPEVRVTATQQKVAKFTLAVGREWKDRNTGEKRSEADFIPCQAWGPLADVVERYVFKGKPLLVSGRISVRKYQDKSGADRWSTDVIVEDLTLLASGSHGDSSGGSYGGYAQSAQARPAQAAPNEPDFPFSMTGAPDAVNVPF